MHSSLPYRREKMSSHYLELRRKKRNYYVLDSEKYLIYIIYFSIVPEIYEIYDAK